MNPSFTHDVIILGGGPGGIRAAEVLAEAGKRVALVSDELGGECLNYGCIPTKTYLWSAEMLEKIAGAKTFGVEVSSPRINWEELKARRTYIVTKLKRAVENNLSRLGVEIAPGRGQFTDSHTVHIPSLNQTVSGAHIIIATGSHARMPEEFANGEKFVTNKDILDLAQIPTKLLIIGGGVVGVEFASVFGALGSEVTLAESSERILSSEDSAVSSEVARVFARKKIKILCGVRISPDETAQYEKVLVAIGRMPTVESLGLEKTGVTYTPDEGIQTSDNLQTNISHIFAIGDVTGKSMLAYTAEREGEIAAAAILGRVTSPLNYDAVPNTIFSLPEVASCGMTEAEAKARELDYGVGIALMAGNAKALIMESRDGFAKVIADKKSGRLLGVHIVGEKATELIGQAAFAIQHTMTVAQCLAQLYSHPVLSEVLKEALHKANIH